MTFRGSCTFRGQVSPIQTPSLTTYLIAGNKEKVKFKTYFIQNLFYKNEDKTNGNTGKTENEEIQNKI